MTVDEQKAERGHDRAETEVNTASMDYTELPPNPQVLHDWEILATTKAIHKQI